MAENDAVQNELTLRQIVDGISALVAVLTPDGAVEIVNRQVLNYFSKTLEELREWSGTDAVHPDDLPTVIALWTRSIESGEPYDIELRQRARMASTEGSMRRVCLCGMQKAASFVGSSCKRMSMSAGATRQRSRVRSKRLPSPKLNFEESSMPSLSSLSRLALTANFCPRIRQAVLDYTGLTKEEVRTESFRDVFHPEDSERLRPERDAAISRGVPFEYERRVRRRDGQYRWLLVQYNPLRDERGAVIRWYATGTDIDDRKRAEDALRSNEESLRLIVDNIPGFVSTANATGELEHVSRQVLEYFGKTAEQMKNWAISDAHHPDDRARAIDAYKHSIETGEPLDCEARNRRADGVYRWFHVRGRPQRDADGRIVRWYNLVTDIDERKRAEEALGQSINDNREMEDALRSTRRKLSAAMQIATVAEMSASIAHEINQPLASVVTNAHACQTWLSHDPPNLERAQATLDRIIRDGHSAAEVVRRIRALFKEAAPVKAPLDMNQIIAEVLRVLSDELRDNSIVVETELAADLPRIAGDHVQIQQTLINLVHNATEAMAGLTDRPKSLVLKSRRQGEELVIEVRDHGVGIKDPALVFEPFFTTKESGMGMGLSISRSIVEAHGGRIWATANEDAGTTFSVALPLASELSA